LAKAKRPIVVVGSTALQRQDGSAIFSSVSRLAEKARTQPGVDQNWKVLNVLQRFASQAGALDLGYRAGVASIRQQKPKVLYLLGADEESITRAQLNAQDSFIIYQGHHGDRGAEIADVVLPGAAYTEKDALYVNTEGRVQQTQTAGTPPGKSREDWQILRALSDVLGSPLPYDDLNGVRARLSEVSPTFGSNQELEPAGFFEESVKALKLSQAKLSNQPLKAAQTELSDFYLTNSISRASSTMAKCVKSFEHNMKNKEKQQQHVQA